jgi:hypothetical protein
MGHLHSEICHTLYKLFRTLGISYEKICLQNELVMCDKNLSYHSFLHFWT